MTKISLVAKVLENGAYKRIVCQYAPGVGLLLTTLGTFLRKECKEKIKMQHKSRSLLYSTSVNV